MTRCQRYYLGHFIAYVPMLCLGLYVGFCQIFHHDVSNLVGPLAVCCMVLFGIGLIIRDKPEQKEIKLKAVKRRVPQNLIDDFGKIPNQNPNPRS